MNDKDVGLEHTRRVRLDGKKEKSMEAAWWVMRKVWLDLVISCDREDTSWLILARSFYLSRICSIREGQDIFLQVFQFAGPPRITYV